MPYTYNSTNPNWKDDIGLSAYSDDWDDLLQFKKGIEQDTNAKYQVFSIVSTTTFLRDVENPAKSLFIVMGVEKEYSDLEVTAIEKFVKNGGKAIIADDGGFATSVSEKFGVYFYPGVLWENETYGIWSDKGFIENKTYPHINVMVPYFNVTAGSMDNRSYEIVTNGPTALYFEKGSEEDLKRKVGMLYANSSKKSYLDVNRNNVVDLGDKIGSMMVIVEIFIGDGKIVFISDPEIFVNGMMNPSRTNNSKFALALVEYLFTDFNDGRLNGGDVIFDESRHNQNKYVENEYQTTAFIAFMMSSDSIGFTVVGVYVEIFPCLLSIAIVVALISIATIKVKDKEKWMHKFDITSFKPMITTPPKRVEEQQEKLMRSIKDKIRIMSSLSSEEVNKMPKEKLRKYVPDKILIDFMENPNKVYTLDELKTIVAKVEEWKR
jgi:hypothetical protein